MIPKLSTTDMEMPVMGFGTSTLENCGEIVATALKVGYRLIDTARKYGTEECVGEALRACGIPRKEIFVATKVSHEDLRAADFARSVDHSLAALQLDYVDLILINWPNREIPLAETMRALAQAQQQGLAHHIGVCNFNLALIKEAIRVCPAPLAVLQAEYHPYLDQSKLLAFCREAGIVFMAYCPVRHSRLFTDPVLGRIARTHRKSIAQIALRWLVQQGNIAPLPRSANPQHVSENINVFDFTLGAEEMKAIATLKRPDGRLSNPPGYAPAWD